MNIILNISIAGDARNARHFGSAPASWRILMNQRRPARFRSELGMNAQLISVDNTQVYIAETDESIVVAFRGSEAPTTLDGFKDWLLTNANNYLILPEGRAGYRFRGGRGEPGFTRASSKRWNMIWAPMLAAVNNAIKTKDAPSGLLVIVWVVHLRLLAAWRLQRLYLDTRDYDFWGANDW